MKIGILGYGEVGKALYSCYRDAHGVYVGDVWCPYDNTLKDLAELALYDSNGPMDDFNNISVLNVCIPWNETFISTVQNYIQSYRPSLVIIHSSVAPKTTQQLQGLFPFCHVVHSPIRGVHPQLHEGLKTFVKYVGCETHEAGTCTEEHFLKYTSIKNIKIMTPSINTELGKLLDTTYYGLCIAFHEDIKRLCDKEYANFDDVFTHFNQTYNEGYMSLGKENVIRPVLYPPNGHIGGHCVIPNSKILYDKYSFEPASFVLRYI